MGCTVNTNSSFGSKITARDKNLPTTIHSGSDILISKPFRRSQSIKSSKYSDTQEALTALISHKALLPRDIDFIGSILHSHFLFKDIDRDAYSQLIRTAKFFKLDQNELIFTQGSRGRFLFIILRGEVEILVNDHQIAVLQSKSIFGEIALMHNTKRTASAKTLTKVELWGLERENFHKALKTLSNKMYMDNKACLDKCEIFSSLDNHIKSKLLELVALKVFENSIIVREGEPGELLFVIKSGKVLLSIDGKTVKEMNEGDYFGDQSLMNNFIRTASVTAVGKVEVLSFVPEDLVKVLGKNFLSMVYRNSILISLSRDKFLGKLMNSQLKLIADSMQISKYRTDEVLVKKGKMLKKIYVLIKGSVKRGENELKQYSCIGSEILINDFFSEYSCVAASSVETAEISKAKIEEMIMGSLTSAIKENETVAQLMRIPLLSSLSEELLRRLVKLLVIQVYPDEEVICRQYTGGSVFYIIQSGEVKFTIDGEYVRTLIPGSYFGERALVMNSTRTATATAKGETTLLVLSKELLSSVVDENIQRQLEERIRFQDFSIELHDLSLLQTLGRGMFGSVFLAVHRETRAFYAVKTIAHSDIRRLRISKNLKSAEEVLLKIDSPFIMRLVKTLRDESRIYFIQEFVDGTRFVDFLQDSSTLNEGQIRFYMSNIVLMLQHLHSKSIAHRDLKPENLILDTSGYLKLVDFDTAKKIKDRSYTVAGTPHYMAPEMIKGNGYSVAVDCWSLGVIFYEVVYQVLPFGEYSDAPLEIYQQIVEGKVEFRNKFDRFRGIIEGLLERNPGKRMDWEKVVENEFFSAVKWEELMMKRVSPPIKPAARTVEVKDVLPEFCAQLIVEEEVKRYKSK